MTSTVSVSSEGRVRNRQRGKHFPTPQKNGYATTWIDGQHWQMGPLILETFGVPKPSSAHTADHKNRKRDDDRLENLRWATPAEQNSNQGPSREKPLRAIEGRRVGLNQVWIRYQSVKIASKATGVLKKHITNCANPRDKQKTAPGANGQRYEFRNVPQSDLPGEEWKIVHIEDWAEGGKYHQLQESVRSVHYACACECVSGLT